MCDMTTPAQLALMEQVEGICATGFRLSWRADLAAIGVLKKHSQQVNEYKRLIPTPTLVRPPVFLWEQRHLGSQLNLMPD